MTEPAPDTPAPDPPANTPGLDQPVGAPPPEPAEHHHQPGRPTEVFRRIDRAVPRWQHVLTSVAVILMLVVLGLALLHFLIPGPVTLALLMSVGNAGFGLAVCCYGVIVVADLHRRRAI